MNDATRGEPPPGRARGRGRRRFGRGRPRGAGSQLSRQQEHSVGPIQPESTVASTSLLPEALPEPVSELHQYNEPFFNDVNAPKPSGRGRHRFPRGRGAQTANSKPCKEPTPPDADEPLSVRQAYELSTGLYECLICVSSIARAQAVWSCSKCFTVLHLGCVADWADRSITDARERAQLLATRDGTTSMSARQANAEVDWRCPACRFAYDADHIPDEYRCFCGRQRDPNPPLTAVPHSCAKPCRRPRPQGCDHTCSATCHPGPCEMCSAVLEPLCHCGKTTLAIRCSQLNLVDDRAASAARLSLLSCSEICNKPLLCGAHSCMATCHPGPCPPCEVAREKRCYCGKTVKEERCSEEDKRISCTSEKEVGSWTGEFSCGEPCPRTYACSQHQCSLLCHAHARTGQTICPRDPSLVRFCPCGASRLDIERSSCSDPIPTCGRLCNRELGCSHACQALCHEGPCPPCAELVSVVCRCGSERNSISCNQAFHDAHLGERLCDRPCRAMRYCGRHVCLRKCCPLAYQEATVAKKGKGKRTIPLSSLDLELDDPLGLHHCDIVCGKLLDCKQHHCQRPDHRGPCGRCLNASFDELRCHCGLTVLEPPVQCGAEVRCSFPCTRPPPPCGHPKTPHTCHGDDESCPACPFLVAKDCPCPRHQPVRNVKCSADKVSCGNPCGRLLSCGWHACRKPCHAIGECEAPCAQPCGKARKLCGHPCTMACHAPSVCSEEVPCRALVESICSCGNLHQKVVCGCCTEQPESNSSRVLKCKDSCAAVKRNTALADALGVDPANRPTSRVTEWPADLVQLYSQNPQWSKGIEDTLNKLIEDAQKMGGKGSHLFIPMRWSQRRFVHEVAERYGLESESLDAEPNRSVFARFKPLSAVPSPLLSAVYAAQAKTKISVLPAARKPTRQSANALLLHGLKSDGAHIQSRIVSHLSAMHDAALSPTEIGGAVLLTLSPTPSSPQALERLRGSLAFDPHLGCDSVELVYVDSSQSILWREKPFKSAEATPVHSRPHTPSVTKANTFAALDKAWTTLPKPRSEEQVSDAVSLAANPDKPTPDNWDDTETENVLPV